MLVALPHDHKKGVVLLKSLLPNKLDDDLVTSKSVLPEYCQRRLRLGITCCGSGDYLL